MENKIQRQNAHYIAELVECLKQADPVRIVLFGSYANGTPNEDSDIDMMVILDNNEVAKTYDERLKKRVAVQMLAIKINYQIPLDILVYSKEEYRIAKTAGNSFLNEVEETGKVIYEKRNSRLA